MALGDSPEMLRMQEEAMQRAREMFLRANPQQGTPTGTQPQPSPQRNPQGNARPTPAQQVTRQEANPRAVPLVPPQRNAAPQAEVQNLPAVTPQANANSILNTLMEDKDRTLILMMLVLLSGEKQSNELMFALLYLLI